MFGYQVKNVNNLISEIMKAIYLSLILVLSLAMFSCQNFSGLNQSTDDDLILKSATIAASDITVESVSEELNYEAEFFAESEHLLKQLAHIRGCKNILKGHGEMRYVDGEGPVVSIDTADTGYPVVITIDYGESTEFKNGRIVSGLVTIEISAERDTDGATRTITYTDCVIDSVAIDGSCLETFNGDNETTRTITTSSDITFVLADGTVIDRTGNYVRNWIAGLDTPLEHDDDQIEKTGSTHAESSEGTVWDREIIEPLLKLGDCRHYVQGVVQYSSNGEVAGTLDFGDGTCDNLATLTVNGESVEIELGGKEAKANLGECGKNKGGKHGRK